MEIAELRLKKLSEFAGLNKLDFQNFDNLNFAFTHSSYLNEHKHDGTKSYEVLEFMGDAVLKLIVTNFLL